MSSKFIDGLSELQIRRPWVPLLAVTIVTCIMGAFALRLQLRTRYDALLPDSQPSVQEVRRVEARTASAQTLFILLEDKDAAALRAMGDDVVRRMLELGPDVVSSAEDGSQVEKAFLTPRAGLFLSVPEVAQLRDDIIARWDYEVAKASDELLDDNGPPVTIDQIENRLRKHADDAIGGDDKSDGYYARKDGTGLVVVVRSPIAGGDLAKTGPALARMEGVVGAVKASNPSYANVRVGYAGDMATGFIEYDRIRNDLMGVGVEGIALVLSAVLLYFMRLRALLVMGVTIAVGLIWTLGVTQIFIGYLDIATGFLISIIAGNGINVGILYQSRYFEERRRGVPTIEALRTAVKATWQPTVIAAVAAAASYLSLLVTDFSAFKHFGVIAATGMLLCWVVKTLMVPPLLLLAERTRPISDAPTATGLLAKIRRDGVSYGKAFAWLVPRAPRLFASAGLALVVAGAIAGTLYVRRDPMQYDLGAIDNDPSDNAELHRVWDGVFDILGRGHEGMVVLTDSPEEAKELKDKLQADWDRAPKDDKPFVAVRSLWSAVPDDQEVKVPMLLEIGDRLERSRSRGYLSDADWAKVKDYVPPADLKPYGLAELPEPLARPFSEKDGTRGRLVVIEPAPENSNDLRYLLRYSNSFRATRLASGKIVRGSGRAVIFADILEAVVHDIPKAVSMSLALTLFAVAITFQGGGWYAVSVVFALLVGVAGEAVFLYLADVKLNFLNFAALPITFGIGVDYAVNVMQRYRADGGRDVLAALRTTGGAVVLCSLTTMLGYLALLGSVNRGIRGLGVIAVVGEVSCLLASVTVLPALWFLVERRRGLRDARSDA